MGFELLFTVFLPAALIGAAFVMSYFVESSHLKRLAVREAELADIFVSDLKLPIQPDGVTGAFLVQGQAVMATDYFKTFVTGLRSLVGGEMRSLQMLLVRARREAVVRMLQEARRHGASEVINVRFETSNVMSSNRQQKGAMCAEIYAYGTAVVRR